MRRCLGGRRVDSHSRGVLTMLGGSCNPCCETGGWYCYDYSSCACANEINPQLAHPLIAMQWNVTTTSYGRAFDGLLQKWDSSSFSSVAFLNWQWLTDPMPGFAGDDSRCWYEFRASNDAQVQPGEVVVNAAGQHAAQVTVSCTREGIVAAIATLNFVAVGYYPTTMYAATDPGEALWSSSGIFYKGQLLGGDFFGGTDAPFTPEQKAAWPPTPDYSRATKFFTGGFFGCFSQVRYTMPLVKWSVTPGSPSQIVKIDVGTLVATITG